MKAIKIKNLKQRKGFEKQELNSQIKKFIYINILRASLKNRRVFLYLLNSARTELKQFSKSKIKNTCVLSGRNRSIHKKLSFSRIKLREMISFGLLPGYKKSVW